MADEVTDEQIEALGQAYRLILVNALGEAQINVCAEGGPIEDGDLLIASSTPGKAMRQADALLRAATAARAREASAAAAQIGCIYLAG